MVVPVEHVQAHQVRGGVRRWGACVLPGFAGFGVCFKLGLVPQQRVSDPTFQEPGICPPLLEPCAGILQGSTCITSYADDLPGYLHVAALRRARARHRKLRNCSPHAHECNARLWLRCSSPFCSCFRTPEPQGGPLPKEPPRNRCQVVAATLSTTLSSYTPSSRSPTACVLACSPHPTWLRLGARTRRKCELGTRNSTPCLSWDGQACSWLFVRVL